MRIAIIGLGQIGGSLARALRTRNVSAEIAAWSPTGDGPRRALEAGAIDHANASIEPALDGADLVVLAGPADAVIDRLPRLGRDGDLAGALIAEATVTDVASTKADIVAAAERAALPFVGGHPMAGTEGRGFEAADANLFEGRPWAVVPDRAARAADVERVEWLARVVGAVPLRIDPADHDSAVAAISHAPLVLSAALTEAVAGAPGWAGSDASRLAAGGWASMTRLARGDATMGAGILATNRGPTADALREVRARLDEWIALLEAEPSTAGPDLRARLERARSLLDA
ncbi:MAG TPA: prephenate dehydrogenase/arogenate dehydrogenase family protein [Candidatus Limnocylindrales bacterium]